MLVVRRREKSLRIRGWVHTAYETGNISRILERANWDRVARPALERLHAGFKVDDDRLCRRQCARERCLADTRRPEDRDSCLGVRDGEALVGRDDPERHYATFRMASLVAAIAVRMQLRSNSVTSVSR